MQLARYLPLFLYPLAPAFLGAMLVLVPKVLFTMVVLAIAWIVWRRLKRQPVPSFGLAIPESNFPGVVGLLVFCSVAFQSVASFCTGIVVSAGSWPVGMLPYVMGPSLLVLLAVVMTQRLSR